MRDVAWLTGGRESAGRREKVTLKLPHDIRVEAIAEGKNLSAMLIAGEVDAILTAQVPAPYVNRAAEIQRLFRNPQEAEREHFKRTGIFPIMHVMVIREEFYRRHPWVAQSLYKALLQAKTYCIESLFKNDAIHSAIPWAGHYMDDTRRLMGDDYWPYGVDANRKTLETFLRHHHSQGLSSRLVKVEELFHPGTLESFKI